MRRATEINRLKMPHMKNAEEFLSWYEVRADVPMRARAPHFRYPIAARHAAWVVLRRLGLTYPEIALLCERDHSTVIKGIRRADKVTLYLADLALSGWQFKQTHCQRPDRHVPGIVCGYPLPCPFHTVTLDLTTSPATLTIPLKGADE